MVMVETEEEAESIKGKIEAGELTMYRAAADHSVAPDAKQNLGELGWIAKGKTKPQLDEVIFALQPGEIGGPVEAGGLWHLISVQDMRDAQYTHLDEPATRKQVRRRYIHDKLDDYVVGLRKNDFPVQVYEDVLIRLAQQEADMVKTLAAQSKEPGSATQEHVKELQKFLNP
jgi:parvulin-like peptidyl-prolyl isomerase